MEKYLINEREVEFEVFLLALMSCKRVSNRHDLDYFIQFLRTNKVSYRYVFKDDKELFFRIVVVA